MFSLCKSPASPFVSDYCHGMDRPTFSAIFFLIACTVQFIGVLLRTSPCRVQPWKNDGKDALVGKEESALRSYLHSKEDNRPCYEMSETWDLKITQLRFELTCLNDKILERGEELSMQCSRARRDGTHDMVIIHPHDLETLGGFSFEKHIFCMLFEKHIQFDDI